MIAKVKFLCIGAQKCGTTTLRAYLREHPQLDVPENEVHFFDNESLNWESSSAVNSYHEQFPSLAVHAATAQAGLKPLGNRILAGEVTPIYMYWLPSLKRIYRYNPEIKLIILLRNPMVRAYSHWSMEYLRGSETLSFPDAIRMEESRLRKSSLRQHRVYSYIDRGFYYKQIMRLFDFFPLDNICILSAETFYCEPHAVLWQVSQFLEISNFQAGRRHHQRRGNYAHSLSNEDWHYIYDRLSGDISMLSSRVDWEVSSWNVPLGDAR